MAVELIGTGVPSVYIVPVGGGNASAVFAPLSSLDGYIPTSDKATNAEAVAGISTTKLVTPSGLLAATTEVERRVEQDISLSLAAARVGRAICPGLTPALYGTTYEGSASVLDVAPAGNVVTTDEGAAYRITGLGQIGSMEAMPLTGNRKWKVGYKIRRAVDSDDPLGDALSAKIIWLNSALTTADITSPGTTINFGATDIVVADGWVTYSAVIANANLSGVNYFNTQAKFFRISVEQQGGDDTPKADVLILTAQDVTNNTFSTDTAADAETRLSALEAASPFAATVQPPGTNIDTLTAAGNYYVVSPAGAPTGAASTVGVRVSYVDANTQLQELYDAAGVLDQTFWRHRISGAWGPFYQSASVAYVDAQIADLANSIALGVSGEFTPTFLAPGATGFSVAYGAATKARYNRSPGGWVNVYGTIQFTPTYSAGAVGIYIGGLPYPAVAENGVFDAPIELQPAGNWTYPANHKRTLGRIDGDDPDAIAIGYEVADTGGASERLNYALSQLVSGTKYTLSFSGGYQDAT